MARIPKATALMMSLIGALIVPSGIDTWVFYSISTSLVGKRSVLPDSIVIQSELGTFLEQHEKG
jgi:hypothetical protein